MVAAIAAAASAAPQPVVPTMTLVARNSVNDCGPSTFINRSSGGSPRVLDYKKIAANIAGGGT
ncbi:unnamed protein product [Penicillium roqueforti FM164]|uniref:Genomic scaffold, ProqFM164S01 n=1 Tax=Penicillium roqueforti (strain FM164) TaxID=1365484 RepID=W6QD82_PENRF|nr:unnamed protein product [Penicillium roqueforti FM164]